MTAVSSSQAWAIPPGTTDSRTSLTLSARAVQRSEAQRAPVRTLTSFPATAR